MEIWIDISVKDFVLNSVWVIKSRENGDKNVEECGAKDSATTNMKEEGREKKLKKNSIWAHMENEDMADKSL